MKAEKFRTGLIAVLLSVAIAMGAVGCMVSGFSLSIDGWGGILLWCALCAAVGAVCFHIRWGSLIFTILAALVILLQLRQGGLLDSIEGLLYQITWYYDAGYGWGIVYWSGGPPIFAEVDAALILMSCLITAAVCWTVCRRRWLSCGLAAGLLPLLLCCVVTDTIPSAGWLWLLLTGLLILILTQRVRRASVTEANRLTAWLLIPAILASSLLFRLNPEDDYVPREYLQGTQDDLLEFLRNLPFGNLLIVDPTGGTTPGSDPGATDPHTPDPDTTGQLDLTDVGQLVQGNTVIFTVKSTEDEQVLYLRGHSYDTYTGTAWESSDTTAGENGWPTEGLLTHSYVSVYTSSRKLSNLYFPYYPEGSDWTKNMVSGALLNVGGLTSYGFTRSTVLDSATYTPLTDVETENYLALPVTTLAAARDILAALDLAQIYTDGEKAELIADYVRQSASYDLNTSRMPEGTADFAIWFLTESDTGYCTHFATATTVLLRAAGIPARYVTGYLTSVRSNAMTNVTEKQAHAWVEYLDPDRGWTVLDATPSVENIPDPTDPPETTVPPETTQPIETTLPSETTQPIETTLPSETTTPSISVSTTQPTTPTGGTSGPEPVTQRNMQWVKWLLAVLLVWALVAGQYTLRRKLRRKRTHSGDPNRQALARWHYARRLAKLTGRSAAELLPLAEKAAFSQYSLTDEELARFDDWFREAELQLKKKPWPVQFLLRLIFAIG